MKPSHLLFICLFEVVLSTGNKTSSICYRCQCLSLKPYSVDCDDMNLSEIPEIPKDLVIPWRLRAQGNSIETIPVFSYLKNLTEINFRFNIISKIEDGAFLNLTSLKILNLAHNKLTEDSINSETFRGQFQDKVPDPIPLEELNLSSNSFSRLPKQIFKHLTNLTSLDLSRNPFVDLSIKTSEALSELQGLKKLSLAYTKLRRLPNHFFSELTNLEELDLSGNDFLTVPAEVNYAHSLTVLSLNDNIFPMINSDDFWDTLANLETLNLKNSKTLSRIEDGAFGNLTSLHTLYLSGNKQLSIICPRAFTNKQNQTIRLKQVNLENNRLHYLPEEALDWKNLKYLDLQDNPWNCDCKFEWVAKDLFPVIMKNSFESTIRITCAYPIELLGQNVGDSRVQNHNFVCNEFDIKTGSYGFVVVATIIVGTLLLVTGTIIFSYVLFRRTKVHEWVGENVKYRRAMNEDEEVITSNIQY